MYFCLKLTNYTSSTGTRHDCLTCTSPALPTHPLPWSAAPRHARLLLHHLVPWIRSRPAIPAAPSPPRLSSSPAGLLRSVSLALLYLSSPEPRNLFQVKIRSYHPTAWKVAVILPCLEIKSKPPSMEHTLHGARRKSPHLSRHLRPPLLRMGDPRSAHPPPSSWKARGSPSFTWQLNVSTPAALSDHPIQISLSGRSILGKLVFFPRHLPQLTILWALFPEDQFLPDL